MKSINTASVLGLGLIGGSIAKALKRKTGIKQVFAFSRTYSDVETACHEGYVDKPFENICAEFLSADMLFICTPVREAVEIMTEHSRDFGKETIITDVGSTKSRISEVSSRLGLKNFIGGHPMAGSEKSGYRNSVPHLFENAFYILTPDKGTKRDDLEAMISVVASFGAIPIILDPEEHDFITAAISHLPHVAAAALVNMAHRLNKKDNSIERLAAGGFKDLTRIASSSPVMWESICSQNKRNISEMIASYISELTKIRSYIDSEDKTDIRRYFDEAKDFRDTLKERPRGSYTDSYDIAVDVEDRPGVIAEIAGILAGCGINIKNMGIPASREYEEGCLLISFGDEKSRIHAISALKKNGINAGRR